MFLLQIIFPPKFFVAVLASKFVSLPNIVHFSLVPRQVIEVSLADRTVAGFLFHHNFDCRFCGERAGSPE